MCSQRIYWSVVPEQTTSPYIVDIATSLRAHGWNVEPFTLRKLLGSENEIVHIQWPEHVSRGATAVSTIAKHIRAAPLIAALRARNHRIVVTAHNRAPHGDSDPIDEWFRSRVMSMADAVVVLVADHAEEVRTTTGAHTEFRTIPHPIVVSPTPHEFDPTRNLLIVLGQIHPYHLIEEFLDGFRHDECPYDVLVTGAVGDEELAARLVERAQNHEWLTVVPGYMDNEALDLYVRRCAALVSLHGNNFNSGGPYFALTQQLPVIMSSGAQADDLLATLGDEWVFPITQPPHYSCAELNSWLDMNRSNPRLERFSLESVTTAHIELYELLRS